MYVENSTIYISVIAHIMHGAGDGSAEGNNGTPDPKPVLEENPSSKRKNKKRGKQCPSPTVNDKSKETVDTDLDDVSSSSGSESDERVNGEDNSKTGK